MRRLLALAVCLLLTGCSAAQADTGRERQVFEDVNEPSFTAPAETQPETVLASSDGSDDNEWVFEQDDNETWLGTDESITSGDFQSCYVEWDYMGDASDFRTAGVVYDGGTRYTWYSENVLPGGGLDELNANGRTVNEDGYVVDGDGYIAVASSDHEIGTELETPWGMARVYDTGCPSGTVDVYTDWS